MKLGVIHSFALNSLEFHKKETFLHRLSPSVKKDTGKKRTFFSKKWPIGDLHTISMFAYAILHKIATML